LDRKRRLVVTADDFGIGPATTAGILHLAERGLVTASVLLVNSPYAADAVRAWRKAGRPMELGWHPCLTLDRPISSPDQVPSLVRPDGRFHDLAGLLRRLAVGLVSAGEVETELRAQLRRYGELVGKPPAVINAHHHLQVFPPVGRILRGVLAGLENRPYVRRVREPWGLVVRVPGARLKRALLSVLGRREARATARLGLPGNDWLIGITDPWWTAHPDYLARRLLAVPGRCVELTTHPGFLDLTLLGRDATPADGQVGRRVFELQRLLEAPFVEACRDAGFVLTPPSVVGRTEFKGQRHAA
jgi:predicted glycoside hydrolase/deacetylase ChbG (UPF0249 family)